MKFSYLLRTICLLLYSLLHSSHGLAISFMGLGDLPGGGYFSKAAALSADGSYVVGESESTNGGEAFRWSVSAGMVGLGGIGGVINPYPNRATSISDDGSIVIGYGFTGGSDAFIWTAETGSNALPVSNTTPTDISSDGVVIVGTTLSLFPPIIDSRAFRIVGNNAPENLGHLPTTGTAVSVANAVSGDGSVVVGSSSSGSNTIREGFRWTEAEGIVPLGDLAGGEFRSHAIDVSFDGSVIVGTSSSINGGEAYRWTLAGGMVGIGDIAGGGFSSVALGVSGDGSIIVGYGTSSIGKEASIWIGNGTAVSLMQYLANNGIDMSGWSLTEATDVSLDGSTIVGYGINPDGYTEAWIANITAPPIPTALICLGDSFEPPFNKPITLKNKVKKAIPVKMSLFDSDGHLIADSDISSPPVVNVSYTPGAGADFSNDSDLVPPGLADEGNEFRFEYPYWVLNLATKQFTSAGTYEVTAVEGDDSYAIDARSCSGTFVRLP